MNDMDDKLIQMAQAAGGTKFPSGSVALSPAQLAAYRSAILADAAKDVQAVAWGIFANHGNIRFWACDKASADSQAAKTGGDVEGLCLASTLAAAQAINAELVALLQEAGRTIDNLTACAGRSGQSIQVRAAIFTKSGT